MRRLRWVGLVWRFLAKGQGKTQRDLILEAVEALLALMGQGVGTQVVDLIQEHIPRLPKLLSFALAKLPGDKARLDKSIQEGEEKVSKARLAVAESEDDLSILQQEMKGLVNHDVILSPRDLSCVDERHERKRNVVDTPRVKPEQASQVTLCNPVLPWYETQSPAIPDSHTSRRYMLLPHAQYDQPGKSDFIDLALLQTEADLLPTGPQQLDARTKLMAARQSSAKDTEKFRYRGRSTTSLRVWKRPKCTRMHRGPCGETPSFNLPALACET